MEMWLSMVNTMPLETHNSLVYSTEKKLVVTIGVDDLIVIDSGDALLVCRRDQAQQVRQVIENLKKFAERRLSLGGISWKPIA